MPGSHTAATYLNGSGATRPFAPIWPVSKSRLGLPLMRLRSASAGVGSVFGFTKVVGTPNFPKYARVRLYVEASGECIAETWSDPVTGAYSFAGLSTTTRFTVVAYDPAKAFRAVIADNLLSELTL